MARPEVRQVRTPHGPGRLVVHRTPHPRATLLLTHGAGSGTGVDLEAIQTRLPRDDVTVVLAEMPWVLAGRQVAPAPAVLDECFMAMLDQVRARSPLVVGGRSAGARVACRNAHRVGAVGVLALAFPLHPPRRPETSRADELRTGLPVLVVQGDRDPHGDPVEFPGRVPMVVVPGADHSFGVRRRDPLTAEEVLDRVVVAALGFVRAVTPERQGSLQVRRERPPRKPAR